MPDIGSVNNRLPPATGTPAADRGIDVRVNDDAATRIPNTPAAPSSDAPVGRTGALGQPTGLPVPGAEGQVLPDVLAGRDASQMAAAERLRQAGGASAVEELLGLNRQPPIVGAMIPPPGNLEALRHMTPAMRRAVMRELLDKQRSRLHTLSRRLRREEGDGDGTNDEDDEFVAELLGDSEIIDEAQAARARDELGRTARMLTLLDELLMLQDYTLSQMGTFSQG